MTKAAFKSITKQLDAAVLANVELPTDIELTPVRCEYVAADKIRVTHQTDAGDLVIYTMKTASLVQSVNLSVALINSFTAQTLRDLGEL